MSEDKVNVSTVGHIDHGKPLTKVIDGGVYCDTCGSFLGMNCDPFMKSVCAECSEHDATPER